MKKFLALLLALTLALSLAVPAYAADTVEDEDFDWAALAAELAQADAAPRAAALQALGARLWVQSSIMTPPRAPQASRWVT